jgi:hypothetical protein
MLPQKTGVSGEHDKMTPRRMQATIGAETIVDVVGMECASSKSKTQDLVDFS